jgi:glycosyltransferase involved in cell wall biosynthesis
MCSCNGAKFLPEQLRSIASQNRAPDELVVCDDLSNDSTVSLLRAFADLANFPVRIVSNEQRLGPAKNFEQAISLCEGDVIVLSDQDDIWRPQKLEKIAEVFDQNLDVPYVFSNADMIDENGKMLGHTMWDAFGLQKNLDQFVGTNQLRLLLRQNLITGASMAFRASFRDIILPIPAGWMHDYWIAIIGSTLSRGMPIADRLLMYRRHPDQTCGWRKKTFEQAVKESIAVRDSLLLEKAEQFREVRRRFSLGHLHLQCSADRLELLMQKETHLLKRATLRTTGGLPRVAGVLVEAFTGRYQRFSNSWYSIARDLR